MTIITTIGKLQESAQTLAGLGQVQGLSKEAKLEVAKLLALCQTELDKFADLPVTIKHDGLCLENYIEHLPLPAHVLQLEWVFKPPEETKK